MGEDIRLKVLKLMEARRALWDEYLEKSSAVDAEILSILRGETSIGDRMKAVKKALGEIWQARHHEPMAFDHVKHSAWLKKKILQFGEATVITKFQSYVTNDEAYYVRARHPFPLFMTNWNSWRGEMTEPETRGMVADTVASRMRGE